MANSTDCYELITLLQGIVIDADEYFDRAEEALVDSDPNDSPDAFSQIFEDYLGRDKYWKKLPNDVRAESKRLTDRLVSLMGQTARAVKSALLVSEADQ